MSENTVLEGLALRLAVAEARGWRMVWDQPVVYGVLLDWDEWNLYAPGDVFVGVYPAKNYPKRSQGWDKALSEPDTGIPAYDTDLNTIKDAAAMLPDTHKLEVTLYPVGESIAVVDAIGSIGWSANRIAVPHTEPATAAWNAVLRWLAARKQEVGNESVK